MHYETLQNLNSSYEFKCQCRRGNIDVNEKKKNTCYFHDIFILCSLFINTAEYLLMSQSVHRYYHC